MSIIAVELSLLDRSYQVHSQAGLNWGYSNGHVCSNDAYIPLKHHTIVNNPGFFPAQAGHNCIEVTWDDGVTMTMLLEGTQEIRGVTYAKQISSYNDKSVLGSYLRNRLNVFNRRITLSDLNNYGRTSILVTKTGDRNYYFNFSN